ncbi:5896_t:CDS:2 [Gigaspora margarita]|uniref:5896_t:CDS:1 n=1 Tax=Gigaspora margarita TaxID=4874 RepID=A0ABN7V9Y9_GIGMA|nr:5896_t:CDS:2 [Gigaspora margarita]
MKFYIIVVVLALFYVVDARYGQEEKPKEIKELEKFTIPGSDESGDFADINGYFGDLSGRVNECLLINAPPCCVQHQCDKVFDVAFYIGHTIGKKNLQAKLVKLCQNLVMAEKNTPNLGQRSIPCPEKPRHKELDGFAKKIKQDPSKGPGRKMKPYKPLKTDDPGKPFKLSLHGKKIAPNCKDFPPRDPRDKCQ